MLDSVVDGAGRVALGPVRELSGVVLADYTTLRVGGSPSRFVEVEKPEEAVEVVGRR